jgi:hypothetical protein
MDGGAVVAQTIVFRRLRWQATQTDGLPHPAKMLR